MPKGKGYKGKKNAVYMDKSAGLVDQVKGVTPESTVTPAPNKGEMKPKKGPVFSGG